MGAIHITYIDFPKIQFFRKAWNVQIVFTTYAVW